MNDNPNAHEGVSTDTSSLNTLIILEVDAGLYDEYSVESAYPGEGCKRISYCSCDCDRCSVPLFH